MSACFDLFLVLTENSYRSMLYQILVCCITSSTLLVLAYHTFQAVQQFMLLSGRSMINSERNLEVPLQSATQWQLRMAAPWPLKTPFPMSRFISQWQFGWWNYRNYPEMLSFCHDSMFLKTRFVQRHVSDLRPGGWLPRQCLNERAVQPYQESIALFFSLRIPSNLEILFWVLSYDYYVSYSESCEWFWMVRKQLGVWLDGFLDVASLCPQIPFQKELQGRWEATSLLSLVFFCCVLSLMTLCLRLCYDMLWLSISYATAI